MRTLACLLALCAACLPPPRLHPRAAEELRRGYQWLDQGDLERADVAFAHALEFHPDLPEAWNGAGVVAHRRGDLAEAGRLFAEAARRAPDFAEARVNLGAVALRQGRHAEAEAHLRAALAVDPDLWTARLDLARTLVDLGRVAPRERPAAWGRARVELLHLLESRPDLAAGWHDLGFLDLAAGRLERAEQAYRRSAELEPSPAALHGLCLSLARLDRCAEAAAACQRCLALDPAAERCRVSLEGARSCAGP